MSESEEGEYEENQEQESDWEKDKKKVKPKGKVKPVKKPKKNQNKPKGQYQSSTYRKEKCQFYNKGNCTKGDLCTYSHDFQPDTAKKICKYFLSGSCLKGTECQYSHNTKIYPCKFFHIENRCHMNNNCRFSHSPISADFYNEYMKDNKDTIHRLYKQDKLSNKDLVEFIQADLPRKEIEPLPMPMLLEMNDTVKAEVKTVWTYTFKKDPRQRIRKPLDEVGGVKAAAQNEPNLKKQQQKIEIKQQTIQERLLTHLKKYFYTYY